ncbi:MAG: competence protein ComFB [Dehalobacter sp. 4CP]|jgi:competence protein ComFB|uniref:Competence protein ComFB n=2 Tax=Dehalobacter restrictus TaxID=55583 RepID=A0A857DIJ9_9FIRM|nr:MULTISPECIES: late competence development ComFB family protein [Dehalobacter]NBJ14903.1 competence protein ComFB [Dehalobacter sp. 4CP]AHF09703.1 Late competence development protein ComFB [Dehalobacter restrictus DSM 9455]MCG1025390.1 late competence development ComFB family protein [Dehalobacter sp.]MCM1564448.1 late competence development ComFB family protein [Dehalobacter sp.]MDJ0306321.1 late competence development ComFB family protein [Dehalobacter sp.]
MYELKNFSEVIVKKTLEDYLPVANIPCKCERCQADIMAFVLNRFPPRYYVSLKGEVMTHFESQMFPDKARVLAEVVGAAQIVAAFPSHPLDQKEE